MVHVSPVTAKSQEPEHAIFLFLKLWQVELIAPYVFIAVKNFNFSNMTFKNYSKFFLNLCARMFWLYMCLFATCVQCLWKLEEGCRLPGTRVTHSHESPHGGWGLNPCLWRVASVLFQGAIITPIPKLTFSEMDYFLYWSNLCIGDIMTLFAFN